MQIKYKYYCLNFLCPFPSFGNRKYTGNLNAKYEN